ncbi:MAG: hypothetical protein KAH32_08990 [Chlamydiia bacterium]|nr:hypothetical protein [Chlamydiia bacterium]
MANYKVLRVYTKDTSIVLDALTLKLAMLKLGGIITDKDKFDFLTLTSAIYHLKS